MNTSLGTSLHTSKIFTSDNKNTNAPQLPLLIIILGTQTLKLGHESYLSNANVFTTSACLLHSHHTQHTHPPTPTHTTHNTAHTDGQRRTDTDRQIANGTGTSFVSTHPRNSPVTNKHECPVATKTNTVQSKGPFKNHPF